LKPETKISLYVIFVFSLFILKSLTVYLVIFCLLCLLSLKVPFGRLKAGWVPITLFLLFTFVSNVVSRPGRIIWGSGFFAVTDIGIRIASVRTLRILLMIMGVKVMMASSRPEEIVQALGRIFRPFEKTGLRVQDFFHTMGLTIQCFPALKDMATDTYREKMKDAPGTGFWDRARVISSFLLPMFVKSIRTPEIFFERTEAGEKKG
jgi:energy-coupling factor transport system permease protein